MYYVNLPQIIHTKNTSGAIPWLDFSILDGLNVFEFDATKLNWKIPLKAYVRIAQAFVSTERGTDKAWFTKKATGMESAEVHQLLTTTNL